MERKIYLITQSDESFIGTVKQVLSDKRNRDLEQAIRDAVDDLVFGDDDRNCAVVTIEVR
jgi:hypothetical protein